MFCRKCGTQLKDIGSYCPNCGVNSKNIKVPNSKILKVKALLNDIRISTAVEIGGIIVFLKMFFVIDDKIASLNTRYGLVKIAKEGIEMSAYNPYSQEAYWQGQLLKYNFGIFTTYVTILLALLIMALCAYLCWSSALILIKHYKSKTKSF